MSRPLIVLCARAGLIRGGVANPAFADYPLNQFDAKQLKELVAEPAIKVVVGKQITAEDVADFIAQYNPPAEATGTGGAASEGKDAAPMATKAKATGKPAA
jgi:hypothetical protein